MDVHCTRKKNSFSMLHKSYAFYASLKLKFFLPQTLTGAVPLDSTGGLLSPRSPENWTSSATKIQLLVLLVWLVFLLLLQG